MKRRSVTASQEDYLEAIYLISSERSVARVKDIAERLSVHKSTVTAALHNLADRDFIYYVPYSAATLTAKGLKIGRSILKRHETLTRFLIHVLGVDSGVAAETACKMEHIIPGDVIDRFTRFAEFFDDCPNVGAKWKARALCSGGQHEKPEDGRVCAPRHPESFHRGDHS